MDSKSLLAQWPLVLILALGAMLSHVFTLPPQTTSGLIHRLSGPFAPITSIALLIVAVLGARKSTDAFWRKVYTAIAGLSVALVIASVVSLVIVKVGPV
ncbi:MAG TPA: hypothetical protein VHY34_08085 [Caulobacteraceae bacterium]|jgi:hypothetical protein|nr:hypothetical protein [Caulobacteraceae bacterium]